jgi:outer membrane usher protein
VPENAGVRIYGDNQLMGRSDRKGLLLLPSLRPYQDNLVGIEQADLPIDVRIDAMSLNAVPFARSGLLLRFPVQRQRGAVLRIVFDDGAALPAGSRVRLAGSDEWFPTGTRGEVYVTGLNEHNLIEVEGAGQTCIITADYPVEAGPLPRLGPFTCRPDLPRSGP